MHKRTMRTRFRMERDLEDIFFNEVNIYESTRHPQGGVSTVMVVAVMVGAVMVAVVW